MLLVVFVALVAGCVATAEANLADERTSNELALIGLELSRLTLLANTIIAKVDAMSAELTRLTASVEAIKAADESIMALVDGLSEQIRNLANDPVKLNELADTLDAEKAAIAAKVLANTPAAPTT